MSELVLTSRFERAFRRLREKIPLSKRRFRKRCGAWPLMSMTLV